jgi:hypothetical protein
MLEWERVMCPCRRAANGITVAIAAVSRFDALSDTEPLKDSFCYMKLQIILTKGISPEQ